MGNLVFHSIARASGVNFTQWVARAVGGHPRWCARSLQRNVQMPEAGPPSERAPFACKPPKFHVHFMVRFDVRNAFEKTGRPRYTELQCRRVEDGLGARSPGAILPTGSHTRSRK